MSLLRLWRWQSWLESLVRIVTLVLPFIKSGEYVTALVTSDSTVDSAIEDIFKSLESAPYELRPHNRRQVLRPLH